MFAGRNGHDNYKEDMKMEQILMLYYSVFPLVSGSVNLYTLIAEIILRYSNQTVQVLSNNVGPALRDDSMTQCVRATLRCQVLPVPDNAAQRTLAWSLHARTHVKSLLLLHTKLASSAARTASFDTAHHHRMRASLGLTLYRICAASHSGRRLNGFDSYSVLAITSRLCIRIRVAVQRRTVAAAVSLRVVARCGARRPAMATMQVREES